MSQQINYVGLADFVLYLAIPTQSGGTRRIKIADHILLDFETGEWSLDGEVVRTFSSDELERFSEHFLRDLAQKESIASERDRIVFTNDWRIAEFLPWGIE